MHPSAVALGNRTIKYGGKSGILPKLRPIFKTPVIAPPPHIQAQEKNAEQGYAKGVPVPRVHGHKISRTQKPKEIVSVKDIIEERIGKDTTDASKLEGEELWAYQRDKIRKDHLRDAYLTEEKRLAELRALEIRKHNAEVQRAAKNVHEESESAKLTLPTIDSYLNGPIMEQRTPEETEILKAKRRLNRAVKELMVKEQRANELLELYQASAEFITTEEELTDAIREAFEVKVGQFESNERLVEDKLFGHSNAYANVKLNETLLKDAAFGEFDGRPGLEQVKSTLTGESEKLRRDAQEQLNKDL